MAKYHVHPNTKKVSVCKAYISCPWSDARHFSSIEKATIAAEKMLQEEFSGALTGTRKSSEKPKSLRESDLLRGLDKISTTKGFESFYAKVTQPYMDFQGSDNTRHQGVPASVVMKMLRNPFLNEELAYKIISIPPDRINRDITKELRDIKNLDLARLYLNSPHGFMRNHALNNPGIEPEEAYNHSVAYPYSSYNIKIVEKISLGLRLIREKETQRTGRKAYYGHYDNKGIIPGDKNRKSSYDKMTASIQAIMKQAGPLTDVSKVDEYAQKCFDIQPDPRSQDRLKIPVEAFRAAALQRFTKKYVADFRKAAKDRREGYYGRTGEKSLGTQSVSISASVKYGDRYSNTEFTAVNRTQGSVPTRGRSTERQAIDVAREKMQSSVRKPLDVYENSIEQQDRWDQDYKALPPDMRNEIISRNISSSAEGIRAVVDTFKSTTESGQQVNNGLNNFVHHIRNLKESQVRAGAIAVKNPKFLTPVGSIQIESHDGTRDFGERVVFSINSSRFMMQKPPQSDEWKDFIYLDEDDAGLLEGHINTISHLTDGNNEENQRSKKRGFWSRLFDM